MAYAVTNPPVKMSAGPLTDFGASNGGSQLWLYKSADAIATVKGASYITNAASLGMQVNDPVLVVDTATPALSLAFVLSINATTGAATLDATPLTAT